MPCNVHPTPFVIQPSDEFAKNIDLRNLSHNLATKYADGHVVTDDDLQIMGRMLWNVLGVQDDFDAAVKEAGDEILSVIIESGKPEVQALPWENLYHPVHKFIGRNPAFTLTRRIAEGKLSQANLDKGPLRVLLFTSLPDNVDAESGRFNVEEEQAQVQEALLPWIAKGLVQLEMPDDGRFSTLKDLLARFDPHVLFLSGHGKFHHEPHADEAYGTFWFESETGDGESIRDEEIARALSETRVQAVILSACESGKAASDYLSNGLMQRISAAGIPHVIGMRESIYDIAGIQFARALCDELAGQERMDVALQSARVAIQSVMDERGQWCLPMALSPNPQAQLIDWDFQPQAVEAQRLNQRVNTVSLPARFVGRRAEMRRYKIKLVQGALRSLLITGAGGMGKTSLAGKLALDVQKARGDGLFAWSANSEKSWRDFELEMGQTLDKQRVERYDKFLPKSENEVERAKFMLDLLAEQFNRRVILFFDNLETLQDADSLAVKDATVAAWMQAARGTDGVTVFATSRWQVPDWDGEHLMLVRANYGDFLQIAAMKNLPIRRVQMPRVYEALGGNIRGLEFFAAAAQSMNDENAEETFLQTLEQTKSDLQAHMAIAEIYKRLPDDAKKLLARLPAYQEPVPFDGLIMLGIDLPNSRALLERLLSVSLLEATYEPHIDKTQYECPMLVADWLKEQQLDTSESEGGTSIAAYYHLYLYRNERHTLNQAITTYHALRRAGNHTEANQIALKSIVNPLMNSGHYADLLNDWLPPIRLSEDMKTRSEAFEQSGKSLFHIADYGKALPCFEQSLMIYRQIGDKAGQGRIFNDMGATYRMIDDYEKALSHYKQSLAIKQEDGDKVGEGTGLDNIAGIYQAQGDYDTALSYLKQALAIKQQNDNKTSEGVTLNNIGQIYSARGDDEKALSYFRSSLVIFQQTSDKKGQGTTLNGIGLIYSERGDFETALSYLKQSLAISQETGDKAGEGAALHNISGIYSSRGDYETALSYLKQSLAISHQFGHKAGEGASLLSIGVIYQERGDYETAFSYYKQSLAIRQQIGAREGESISLDHISGVCWLQGDYEKALSFRKQSLEIKRKIGDKVGEGTALGQIGVIVNEQGDHETALAYCNQSLNLMQKIGNKKGEASTLIDISQIKQSQGDFFTALYYSMQSLAISEQLNDKDSEGKALSKIGAIYNKMGDQENALAYHKKSLAVREQTENKSEKESLNNIAEIKVSKGEYKSSLIELQQSLAIYQQSGNQSSEQTFLCSIGQIYEMLGEKEIAVSYLKRSLAITQQVGDQASECSILSNLGQIYSSKRDYSEALSYLNHSLTISQKIGEKEVEREALESLGDIFSAQGDFKTAIIYVKRALNIRQEIGDKEGLCAAFFNIGYLYEQNKQLKEAGSAWLASYVLAMQIGNLEILHALGEIASQLSLPEGLKGWDQMAQEK